MRPPSLLIAAALQHCVLDARVTFVGAQVLYANEARNAADREIDCSDISAVLADVNEKCCNGGRASSSQTGHRRAQGSSGTCALDTCTPACAEVFVGMMADCNDQLPTMGSDFSILSEIQGADSFLATCESVLSPPGDGWIPTRSWFLAMDPGMQQRDKSSGFQPEAWLWRSDPGNTGVWFADHDAVQQLEATHRAPFGWTFDPEKWWVEEHGAIMETPEPLPPGKYKVMWLNRPRPYGVETVTLTVAPDMSWSLGGGATLHSVTHMPCRCAMYSPPEGTDSCVPENLPADEFPVTPGAMMPAVRGCDKMDYAVLFVHSIWG